MLIKELDYEEKLPFYLQVNQHLNEKDGGSLKNNADKIQYMIEM